MVRFEWDEGKNAANQRSHGLAFEEAIALFKNGVDYLEIFDSTHSIHEDRFISIGPISRGLVVVVWRERSEDVVRIISARMATGRESNLFVERMRELS